MKYFVSTKQSKQYPLFLFSRNMDSGDKTDFNFWITQKCKSHEQILLHRKFMKHKLIQFLLEKL